MALTPTYSGGASKPLDRPPVFRYGVQAATLTGATTLTRRHPRFLALDPGGANRDVTLPAGVDGDLFVVYNSADASEDLVVKNPAAATLATLGQGSTGMFACEDGTWRLLMAGTTSSATMTTDTIAESSAAHGVIIDGLRLKDAAINPVAGGAAFIDLSNIATGEGDVILKDNLASAFEIREGANTYVLFRTTDDLERVRWSKLMDFARQTIDMNDLQVALVLGTAGAGQLQLTGQFLAVDANSSGTEDLLLPPEASCDGLILFIANTGSEDIIVKEDSDTTTICTVSTTESAIVMCDGTTWRGGVLKVT